MKFNNWKLVDLIDFLKLLKRSELFDYRCTPMCSGEITFYNGEDDAESFIEFPNS